MFIEMRFWLLLVFNITFLSGCISAFPEKFEKGVVIKGVVRDLGGNPVPNVKVKTYLYTGVYFTGVTITRNFKEFQTDDNGEFLIHVREGYSMEVYVEDYGKCWFSPGVTVNNKDFIDGEVLFISLKAERTEIKNICEIKE